MSRVSNNPEQPVSPGAQSAPSASKFKVLDLFSGIGAYSLGLERTGGFKTVALCEIEEYPRRILRKHWPDVPIYEDVRAVTGADLRAAGIVPNWIVAGWPCQGNSPAGTGLGMDDPRSGLWSEIARLAGEIRPEGLLLENSSNLLNINGGADFGRVIGDLAALGYDAEWHCLPAAAFDAPHIRDRVWIVATLADAHARQRDDAGQTVCPRRYAVDDGADAHADGIRSQVSSSGRQPAIELADVSGEARSSADFKGLGRQPCGAKPAGQPRRPEPDGDYPTPDAYGLAPIGTAISRQERVSWEPEPDVVRVVHGASNRVERIHALGNLNPPIIPEMIGRAFLASVGALRSAENGQSEGPITDQKGASC